MIAPVEIRLRRAENLLEISFNDGQIFQLSPEFLRVQSPSAEVQGHGPGQATLIAGKRDVAIAAIEPTGNYAVRLVFSDGHDTGIFSWDYLHQLGREQDARWRDYLQRLEAAGLTRE